MLFRSAIGASGPDDHLLRHEDRRLVGFVKIDREDRIGRDARVRHLDERRWWRAVHVVCAGQRGEQRRRRGHWIVPREAHDGGLVGPCTPAQHGEQHAQGQRPPMAGRRPERGVVGLTPRPTHDGKYSGIADEERIRFARIRLCLSPDRDGEIARALDEVGDVGPRRVATIWWDR